VIDYETEVKAGQNNKVIELDEGNSD